MSIAFIGIADNRPDYHLRSLMSAWENLWEVRFDQHILVHDADHKLGFAGAIDQAWSQVDCDFAFHLELDFTFNQPVPMTAMQHLLRSRPELVQIALLRQPWNAVECEAGSLLAVDPDSYERVFYGGFPLTLHRKFVTTNPALWPRWVIDRGWPQIPQSEGHFGIELFASDPKLRSAFFGHGQEYVNHIGNERTGRGY